MARRAVLLVAHMRAWRVLFFFLVSAACSTSDGPAVDSAAVKPEAVALQFAQALADRRYADAYEMTSAAYRGQTSMEQMRGGFESIVPNDWKFGPIIVGNTMDAWPDKQRTDVRWVYVSIAGESYGEGLTTVIGVEGTQLKVRHVEFGRP